MKALVLGAAGQLGSELMRLLPDAAGLTRSDLSIVDRSRVDDALHEHGPELVFNCAAYNAVDRAERERELAYGVNSEGAFNVALACAHHQVRLVHFSTNFVFDGALHRPYVESDAARPLGVYAKSKLDGEGRVLAALPGALVIRSAALFGDRGSAIKGGSFPQRIVERARTGERLAVVSDQRVNPTYARDLAVAVVGLAATELSGIVHLVAGGCCSWHEFATSVLEACGVSAQVEAVTSSEQPAPAARPLNGCLGSTRVSSLRPWQEGLREWASGVRREPA